MNRLNRYSFITVTKFHFYFSRKITLQKECAFPWILVNLLYYDLSRLTYHIYPMIFLDTRYLTGQYVHSDIEIRALDFIRFLCYYFPSKSLRKLPLFRTTIETKEKLCRTLPIIFFSSKERDRPIAIPFLKHFKRFLKQRSIPPLPLPPTGSEQRSRKR